MTFEPLLQASPSIQFHVFAAMGAFVLGAVQLVRPKGTLPHRIIGSIWVLLMQPHRLVDHRYEATHIGRFATYFFA